MMVCVILIKKIIFCIEGMPPVGAYDIKHFDMANKVIKEEEDIEISPKKPPFNSANPRFKERKTTESKIFKEKDG